MIYTVGEMAQKQAKNLFCRSCRRTTTSPYRPTLKREFCWFCTVASKARKRLLVVVTTGFSVFYGASAQ